MASQWNANEEYNISQVTPDIPDGRTPRTEGSRLIFVRGATGGQFVHINSHQIEMQDLDLYMRTDLVSKASDVVNEADVHHASRPPNHGEFDDTGLGLVTSDASLLMHPEQTDLEANAFVTSSNSQLPELVPQCLHSLGVSVSEAFQSQHTPQDPQHHSSLLQVRNDQQHQHLQVQQHLDRQHHECQQTQEQRPTDLLLTQTMDFDSSDTHPLTDQSVCHDHASTLALQEHQQHQPVSNSTPQASQSQLPSQGVLPLSSFHLHENIMGTSSLNSKPSSVASESNNLRPDECDVSVSPSSTTLPFIPSNPSLQAMSAANAVMRPETTPLIISSASKMVGFADINSFGRAKKRKIAEKSSGDMVWLNSKSLESRQRDRHATQILIEIVSQPKWQEQLTSSTTKKKTVWREIGEEFSCRGYYLENPGKKCFQKWRNLERSFREYELSKKALSSSVTKCLPDFYEELRPILKEKLSSSLDITYGDEKGEGGGIANVRLMEKYVDFDSGPSATFIKDRGDLDPDRMPEPGQSREADDCVQGNGSVELKDTVDCFEKSGGVFTTEREDVLKVGGKQEQCVSHHKAKNSPGHPESMSSLLEGFKSQQKDLAEMTLALQSIKGLLEEQKKEREATNAESKQRFLELKAIIDKNQKEKMAFMFEFLKSFKQNHNNGEKS